MPLTLDDGSDTGSGLDTTTGVIERSEATLADGTCGAFGPWSPVTLTAGADTTVQTGTCYRYRYSISDNVGNQSAPSTASATAKIDTTDPSAPSLTLSESSPFSDAQGTTLYYNPQASNGASFDVSAVSADAQSGIQKVAFPALAGMTGGGDDTDGPYSGSYTWNDTTAATGSHAVTVTNGAGSTSSDTFTVTPDTTAPTGQSADLTAGQWYTTLSVSLTLVGGTDAGSGLDVSTEVVERSDAALSDGTCDTFGPWSPVTLTAGADTTVTNGNCYRYRLSVTDNVGNASAPSSASSTAKVDTSAPVLTAGVPTALTGDAAQHYDATTSTLWFRPSGTGSFSLGATAADAQSGVVHVSFPDVSGTTGWTGSTGGNDSTGPYSSPADYSWTSGADGLGSLTITAGNGSGLSTADSLTVSADSTAPTGQTADLTGGPWYTTLSVPLTLDNGADSQSGIDSATGLVERSEATLSNGTCGTFGPWTTVTLTAGADTTVTSGTCYRYRYTVSDNVGNASTPSTSSAAAKVDTTVPSAPAVTLTESSAFSSIAGRPSTTTRRAPTPAPSPSPPRPATRSRASPTSTSPPCTAATPRPT